MVFSRSRKGEITQVFVWAVSLIIVVFVGYMAVKFVIGFGDSAKDRQDFVLFDTLKKDYASVFTSYNSQKVFTYSVSANVDYVCFVGDDSGGDSNCGPMEINTLIRDVRNSGDNVMIFGSGQVLGSSNLGEFNMRVSSDDPGCRCFEVKNGKFSVLMENVRNVIWVKDSQ